jgi:hypothetical protein
MIRDCVFCKSCTYDDEYITHPRSRTDTIVGGALFCENKTLKEYHYNTILGKRKSKKEEIDVNTEPPVLVGKVIWICKGQYFEDVGRSVFEEDPTEITAQEDIEEVEEAEDLFEGFDEDDRGKRNI